MTKTNKKQAEIHEKYIDLINKLRTEYKAYRNDLLALMSMYLNRSDDKVSFN